MDSFSLQGMRKIKESELDKTRLLISQSEGRKRPFRKLSDHLKDSINIIAEIKKSSPSQGSINNDTDILSQLESYSRGGASAISVLTEENYFNGSPENLKTIAEKCDLPVLWKDFVYFDEQVEAAALLGADLILLIVRSLETEEFERLYKKTVNLGLTPLVEIHEYHEYERIKHINPEVILVNMRNLETLEIKFHTGIDTLKKLPENLVRISASGINGRDEMEKIISETGVKNFLIGTSLMKTGNPEKMLGELKNVH